MKYILFPFLLIATALAAEINPASEIKAVTVFPDRARVTRAAQTKIPAGESVITIKDLPVALDTQSIKVSATANGELQILGIDIKDKFQPELANKAAEELTNELQKIRDDAQMLTLQGQDITEQKLFLQRTRDGIAAQKSKEDTGVVNPDGIKVLYAFYSDELLKLTNASFKTTLQIRELEPKIRTLEQQIAQLRGSSKATKEASIVVNANKEVNADVFIDYNIGNATWTPIYDARVETKKEQIQLDYKAQITQQTGEDWKNVKLSLSTAKPSVEGRMPELQPWWLTFYRPAPAPAPISMQKASARNNPVYYDAAPDSAGGAMPAMMEAKQEAVAPAATIKNDGFSAVFDIAQAVTIPCDGAPHLASIISKELKTKFGYSATPKLSELAYLKAALVNTTGTPILGGKVNIFRDGDFIGTSQINFVAADAKFDLFLGPDENIKITYKVLADVAGESWFGNKKETSKKYETVIENFRAKPTDIAVIDQLPVAQDKDIVISDTVCTPPPTTTTKDTGQSTWNLTLQPKEKKTISKSFKVTWPSDKNIIGL